MSRIFKLINQNCRLATRLLCEAHDHVLSPLERWGMRIHLIGCRSCRRYSRQIHLVDEVARSMVRPLEPQLRLSSTAQNRIIERLRSNLD